MRKPRGGGYNVQSDKILVLYNKLSQQLTDEGSIYQDAVVSYYYITNPSIPIYIYDYEIQITEIRKYIRDAISNSTVDIVEIRYAGGSLKIKGNKISHDLTQLPTSPIEAILTVEFAKQYGIVTLSTLAYVTNWYEFGKVLQIYAGTDQYLIYGAGSTEYPSGTILRIAGGTEPT